MEMPKDEGDIEDGMWWTTATPVWWKCPECGRSHRQRATVMRYRPEMDFDGGTRHPGWKSRGWLWWGWCRTKRSYFDDEVVDTTTVRGWDTQAGNRWRLGSDGKKGQWGRLSR